MTWPVFVTAIREYIKRYKWQTATLTNFLAVMQEVYEKDGDKDMPIDFELWKKEWLMSKGFNKMVAEPEVAAGKYNKFQIKQTICANSQPYLRT